MIFVDHKLTHIAHSIHCLPALCTSVVVGTEHREERSEQSFGIRIQVAIMYVFGSAVWILLLR